MKHHFWLAFAGAALALTQARPASADTSTIKLPGAHPSYLFEAEPHLLVAPFDDFRPGIGFRGTLVLVDNGFVQTINNSVGLGFGADWSKDHFRVPVVMQWNFWLHRQWSVFGEPGLAMYVEEGDVEFQPFVLYAGGRFHVTDRITLTMRLGYPTFSFGASFLL